MKQKLIEYATRNGMLIDEGPLPSSDELGDGGSGDQLRHELERFDEIWSEMHNLLREAEKIVRSAVERGDIGANVRERAQYYWAGQIRQALGFENQMNAAGPETMRGTIAALAAAYDPEGY